MLYSLLITAREGLEAGLIVAIVLSYLARTNQRRYWRQVWLGAGVAFAGSIAAAAILELTAANLSYTAQAAFEGGAMIFAVLVLTGMIFWMKRQAVSIGRALRAHVEVAIRSGSALALALLAFTAVGREGLETVLFLFAGSARADSTFLYWFGAGAGLAVAAALAYVVYASAARLPLSAFFNVTGVLLIILAAGLLVNGLKELHEIGATPNLGPHLWDTYNIIADNSDTGRFLSTIFGYDSSPYLGLVVAYGAYLVPTLAFFTLRRERTMAAPKLQAAANPASGGLEREEG
ncbi:MAG: FTR1 family protein [Chloroflexota bacterium]|nr:FTR1 family protein [Chloroflexota bacterium]